MKMTIFTPFLPLINGMLSACPCAMEAGFWFEFLCLPIWRKCFSYFRCDRILSSNPILALMEIITDSILFSLELFNIGNYFPILFSNISCFLAVKYYCILRMRPYWLYCIILFYLLLLLHYFKILSKGVPFVAQQVQDPTLSLWCRLDPWPHSVSQGVAVAMM